MGNNVFTTGAEEARIQTVYDRRKAVGKNSLYSWHRKEVLLNRYRFRAVVSDLLARKGLTDFSTTKILDVGCGTGAFLRTLMEWNARPENLHGIDLLQDRIDHAKALSTPLIDFRIASGYSIPFPDFSLDLVSAHTVFSSILDSAARMALAKEMIRILKLEGKVLIYDFRISDPRNPDTTGIRKSEIRRIFPGMKIKMRSLTLAPPLARRIAPLSSLLAHAIEVFCPFLRTHMVYLISRE